MILLVGLPISRYAIRHGVDIDLLTRGAELRLYRLDGDLADLCELHLHLLRHRSVDHDRRAGALRFGIPPWIGYIISAVVVIPLVTHGVQLHLANSSSWTQPFWIVLNILPFVFIAFAWTWEPGSTCGGLLDRHRTHASGEVHPGTCPFRPRCEFGAASAVIFALMAQIGEQVDFLRFLPPDGQRKLHHRFAQCSSAGGGTGWVVVGGPKLILAGLVPRGAYAFQPACLPPGPADPSADVSTAPSATCSRGIMAALAADGRRHSSSYLQLKINVMNSLCGFARLVELLLAPDPQPSRPRRLAGLQRGDRACS
jgi:hypothetical protein